MDRRVYKLRPWTGAVAVLFAATSAFACQANQAAKPAASQVRQATWLRAEVERLGARVVLLERKLEQDHRTIAKQRVDNQEQRARLVALEAQSAMNQRSTAEAESNLSIVARMTVEAELRQAYQAVMRAIERMDISTEERAALKNSLRPTRAIDSENPWASASKQ
jgi:hypothetical protein